MEKEEVISRDTMTKKQGRKRRSAWGIVIIAVLTGITLLVLLNSFKGTLTGRPGADLCGNGVVDAVAGQLYTAEGCDDGNVIGLDGCSSVCQVEAGWACSGSGCQMSKGEFLSRMKQVIVDYDKDRMSASEAWIQAREDVALFLRMR